MKNLIPLSDFVLEQEIRMSSPEIFKSKVYAYANFLKQPLTLEMFVAVDKHGVVLEPLQFCCTSPDCGCMGMPVNVSSQEEIDEYYEALEKVLFEGFEQKGGLSVAKAICQTYQLIEDLTYKKIPLVNLTLTPSALQQIGIKE
ncbi:hypothetical protein [Chryseobacterium taichungense]|uniref:hypothetical protein n=1 Tax=Chryseobacterium taichungense TaxID=295069 RepID=UPI0028A61B65|nr:hypothetical protein [Chryseobacterium taichungense]